VSNEHNRITERAPMRRGLTSYRAGSDAAGATRSTAVLFGDVRAGRAAARSFVLGFKFFLQIAERLIDSSEPGTDGNLSCGALEWRSGQGCLLLRRVLADSVSGWAF